MKKTTAITLSLLTILLISAILAELFIANRYILTVNFYERNGQAVADIPGTASLIYEKLRSTIYLAAIVYILVKIVIISLLLATGLYFFKIELPFAEIATVVVSSEFIFLIPALAKICWFWQDKETVDLVSWQNFYFLSAASLCEHISPAWLLPLQTMNVFEVAYWLLLAGGIERIAGIKFTGAFKVVSLSYIPALVIWELAILYFTIVYFPQSL